MSQKSHLEKMSSIMIYAGIVCFSLAFILLGVIPANQTQQNQIDRELVKTVPEEFQTYYQDVASYRQGLIRGRDRYIAEACWHCHSQYVRPVSNESLRYGPVSTPGEYQNILQLPQLFGTRRVGPDLIREAGKRTNDWHFAHFFNPRSVEPQSVMPSYTWLYQQKDGKIIPKQAAVDLVAYMQWLGSWVQQRQTMLFDLNAITLPPKE